MTVRHARMEDLEDIADLEALCFPPQEAADKAAFRERIAHYGNHFWLLYDKDRLISMINGFVSDCPDLQDSMYADAQAHQEDGDWQMIFGVNTHPDYRHRGYASRLMKEVIRETGHAGKKGIVLTCKEGLIPFYQRFGFADEGISASVHGQTVWHQMRLTLPTRQDKETEDTAE